MRKKEIKKFWRQLLGFQKDDIVAFREDIPVSWAHGPIPSKMAKDGVLGRGVKGRILAVLGNGSYEVELVCNYGGLSWYLVVPETLLEFIE